MPTDVTKRTPGQSNLAALILTATCIYLKSLQVAQKNCGLSNPSENDYHSDSI
jgi:hypothetical protein